jgi:hypothetical protein
VSCVLSGKKFVLCPVGKEICPVSCVLLEKNLSCVLCPVGKKICPVSCVLCHVSCQKKNLSCVLFPLSCWKKKFVLCPVSCLKKICLVSCFQCPSGHRTNFCPSGQIFAHVCLQPTKRSIVCILTKLLCTFFSTKLILI